MRSNYSKLGVGVIAHHLGVYILLAWFTTIPLGSGHSPAPIIKGERNRFIHNIETMRVKVMKKIVVILALMLVTAMVAGCVESSTSEVTKYSDKVRELNERTLDILTCGSDAIGDVNDGKISLATCEYLVTDCSEDMNTIANEAALLSPPPGYEEFHGHWIKMINLCNSSMFEMTLFFEDGNKNHLDLSLDMLEESSRELQLAKDALP